MRLPSLHRLSLRPTTGADVDGDAAPLPTAPLPARPFPLMLLPPELQQRVLELLGDDPCKQDLQRICTADPPNHVLHNYCPAIFRALCFQGVNDPQNPAQVAAPYRCNIALNNGVWAPRPNGEYNPYNSPNWEWVKQFALFCSIEHLVNATYPVTAANRLLALQTLRDLGSPQLTTIPMEAFQNFVYVNIDRLPDTITQIGARAFEQCHRIPRMQLPAPDGNVPGLRQIGPRAFMDCINLQSINLPDSIIDIGRGAFKHCARLTQLTFPTNQQYTAIYPETCEACTRLTHVVIPDTNHFIGMFAFHSCFSLTHVQLGNYLQSISNNAFENCTRLQHIGAGPNGMAANHLPTTLHMIGLNCFNGCIALESIRLPNPVTTIPDGAFRNCFRLRTVNLGVRVHTIQSRAFADCTELRRIVLPNTMRYLDVRAFQNCNAELVVVHNNIEYNANDLGGVYTMINRM